MAFTLLSVPGIFIFSPFSFIISRPFSLTSKAIALARLVDVVFKFTLNATRKSLAPTAVAPDFLLKTAGPKSGFHSGPASFFSRPSYSPDLQAARFLRSSLKAAFS